MRKTVFAAAAVLLAVVLPLLFGCGSRDLPPDDGTPWPEALSGRFVYEDSALTFTGDGVTVTLSLSETLAEKLGLPAGKTGGSYAFLFRNESWRYDFAETLALTAGDVSARFIMTPGSTTARQVCFNLPDSGEQIRFIQED